MTETTQLPNAIELKGTPEQLGKELYRFLCGKKEEGKENV